MPTPARNDKNTLLMKACGSKTGQWDPEPPDQWKYQMYHGDAIARVVGWVKSKTTAYSRSAFAVDEKGKVLTLKHMASDLGWKHKTAINIAVEAAQEGLIRIESNGKKDPGRIYLCAEVPNIGRRNSEVNSSVQRNYPPYLLEQIERMSDVQRRKFEASYGAFWKWSKDAMGDGVAELRSYIEQVEDTTLQAFGLEKKREVKRRVKKTHVRVELPEVPDFVHSVQSELCTKPETGNVQRKNEAHIKEADTDKSRTPPLTPPQTRKAEDEEATPALTKSWYPRFKASYPAQRFDESKAAPIFKALPITTQETIVDRMHLFLNCELWKQTPRYIPLASNFLKRTEYAYDPPPMIENGENGPILSQKDREARARVARIAAQLDKEKIA